ncbi:hypothetical protein HKBW3C_03219, partial [Candidatus Hakubella thermalkaliphila]
QAISPHGYSKIVTQITSTRNVPAEEEETQAFLGRSLIKLTEGKEDDIKSLEHVRHPTTGSKLKGIFEKAFALRYLG